MTRPESTSIREESREYLVPFLPRGTGCSPFRLFSSLAFIILSNELCNYHGRVVTLAGHSPV